MDIKREVHDIRAAVDVIVSKFEVILAKNNVFVASAAPLAQGSPLAGWQAGRQKDNVHVARLTTESMALKQHNETLNIENAQLKASAERLDRNEKITAAALQNTQAHNEQLTSNLAKISADNQTAQAHNEQLTAKLAKISADIAAVKIQNIDLKSKFEAAARLESTSGTSAFLASMAIAQDTSFAGQGSSMCGGPVSPRPVSPMGRPGSHSVPMPGVPGMQSPRPPSGMASPAPCPQRMPPGTVNFGIQKLPADPSPPLIGVSVELQKSALVAAGSPVTLKAALDAGMVPVPAGIGPTPPGNAAGVAAAAALASLGMQSPYPAMEVARGVSNGASGNPQMGIPQVLPPNFSVPPPGVDTLGTPTLIEFPTGNPFLAGFSGQPSSRPGTPGRLASSQQVAMPPQLPRGSSVSVPSPMKPQTNVPAPMRSLSPARLQSPPPLGGTTSGPQRSVTPSWAFSGQPGQPGAPVVRSERSFTDVLFEATDRNQDGLISQFEFRHALTNDIIRPAGQITAPLGLPGHLQSAFPP